MILVLLGTHELPFYRLIKAVDDLAKKGFIKEECIIQSGYTNLETDVVKLTPFINYEEMENLYERASLIITHAGTGSVITGLKKEKKIIAVPRLKKYGEHNDDHQLELANVFEEAGHVLVWREGLDLKDLIIQAEEFSPNPFHSQKDKLIQLLEDYIQGI